MARLFANTSSASESLCFDKGGLYFGYLKDYAKGLTLQPWLKPGLQKDSAHNEYPFRESRGLWLAN